MGKIVRNKPVTPADADAIAAFGAAADARPEDVSPAPAKAAPIAVRKASEPKPPPESSLIRWKGNEDLRDAIIEYSARERYSIHTVLLEAIRRGFDQMES